MTSIQYTPYELERISQTESKVTDLISNLERIAESDDWESKLDELFNNLTFRASYNYSAFGKYKGVTILFSLEPGIKLDYNSTVMVGFASRKTIQKNISSKVRTMLTDYFKRRSDRQKEKSK